MIDAPPTLQAIQQRLHALQAKVRPGARMPAELARAIEATVGELLAWKPGPGEEWPAA